MPWVHEELRHDHFLDDFWNVVLRRYKDESGNYWWANYSEDLEKIDAFKISYEPGLLVVNCEGNYMPNHRFPNAKEGGYIAITRHMIVKRWDGELLGMAQSTGAFRINPKLYSADPATFLNEMKDLFYETVDYTTLYTYMLAKYTNHTHYVDGEGNVKPITFIAEAQFNGVLASSLDIEFHSENYYGKEMYQSPIVTIDLIHGTSYSVGAIGKLNFKTDTNWWNDSKILVQGNIDTNSFCFILRADTAPIWHDGKVPQTPFYFGDILAPKAKQTSSAGGNSTPPTSNDTPTVTEPGDVTNGESPVTENPVVPDTGGEVSEPPTVIGNGEGTSVPIPEVPMESEPSVTEPTEPIEGGEGEGTGEVTPTEPTTPTPPTNGGTTSNAFEKEYVPVAMFGGKAVHRDFDFDNSYVITNEAIMPTTRNYVHYPSNGIDSVMVKRTKFGAMYQAHYLSWEVPPNDIPPQRAKVEINQKVLDFIKDNRFFEDALAEDINETTTTFKFKPSGMGEPTEVLSWKNATHILVDRKEVMELVDYDAKNWTLTVNRGTTPPMSHKDGVEIWGLNTQMVGMMYKKGVRTWNNLTNDPDYYKYTPHPSRYSGKVHASRLYVVHPENGVVGELPNLIVATSINLYDGTRLTFSKPCGEDCEEYVPPERPESKGMLIWEPIPNESEEYVPPTDTEDPPVEPDPEPTDPEPTDPEDPVEPDPEEPEVNENCNLRFGNSITQAFTTLDVPETISVYGAVHGNNFQYIVGWELGSNTTIPTDKLVLEPPEHENKINVTVSDFMSGKLEVIATYDLPDVGEIKCSAMVDINITQA